MIKNRTHSISANKPIKEINTFVSSPSVPAYNFKDTPQYIEFELMKDKFAELMVEIGIYFKMCDIDSDALLNSAQLMADNASHAVELATNDVIRFTDMIETSSDVETINHCLSMIIYNLYQLLLLQIKSKYKNDNLMANNIVEAWSKRGLFMANGLSNLIKKEEKSLLKLKTVKGRENRAYNLNDTRTFAKFSGFVPDDIYNQLVKDFAVRNNFEHIFAEAKV